MYGERGKNENVPSLVLFCLKFWGGKGQSWERLLKNFPPRNNTSFSSQVVLGGLNRQSANLSLADLGPWAKTLPPIIFASNSVFLQKAFFIPLFWYWCDVDQVSKMISILSYKNGLMWEILHRFAMIYHMSKEVARNRADTMPALPAVVNAAVAAKYPHPSCSISSKYPHFPYPSCSTSAKYPHRHLNDPSCSTSVCQVSPIHLEVEPNAGRWHRRVQRRRTTARRDFRSKQVICELSKTYLASAFSTVKLTSRLVLLVGEWLTWSCSLELDPSNNIFDEYPRLFQLQAKYWLSTG